MKRAVIAVMLCSAALLLPANALATTTVHFASTGAEQTFEVPAGVYQVEFVAIGGRGGEASGVAGGEAAEAEGPLEVDQFQTLYVEVGGNGKTAAEGGAGGFNGGGSSSGGGGGGGASDIRTSPGADGLSTDTREVAAGGGGGAAGAGPEGPGGKGGAASEAGETSSGGNEGGGPGTTTGGGGAYGCGGFGETGQLGLAGAGGPGEFTNGGGGFWGGGGGGGGCTFGGGGGGGGSTLLPALALMTLTSAGPKIDISYNPPPTVTITTPPEEEAAYTQGQAVNANYNCLPGEGTSVKTCAGPVANGAPLETATIGEHEFLVAAEDNDKGKAGRSNNYTVFAPPAVEITSPAEGATYTQGQTVSAAYACVAAAPLVVESCTGPAASGAAVDTAHPGPQTFTVEAEDSIGGTTTRSVHYTVAAASGGPPPPSPTATVPDTTITAKPKKTVKTKKKKATVKFSFSSDVAGATFQCKLDKAAFAPCTSPKTYKVKTGSHTFSVEAVGPGGTDPSPATFKFKVKKKK
jgi:hypothetical protein